MPEQTATAAKPQTKNYMAPFEVEVSTKNSGQWHSVVLSQTFRGRWSRHKLGSLANCITVEMSSMPDIPGIRLKITPKTSKIVIHDPLEGDTKRLAKISDVCHTAFIGFNAKFEAVESTEITLDADTFKTFLHEVYNCIETPNPLLEVVSGDMPSIEDIDALPGREFYDMRNPYKRGVAKYVGDEDRLSTLMALLEEKGIFIA